MSELARALISELGPEELAELASRLAPYIRAHDGWLSAREAAEYAGCSIHALRHAMSRGEVEFEQQVAGGKAWFTRASLDNWRRATKGA